MLKKYLVYLKRLKCDLVNHFYDKKGARNKKTKAYLVRTDSGKLGGSGIFVDF